MGVLKKLIDSEKTEIQRNDIYSVMFLKGDGVVGEATTIYGKVIHLVGMKMDKNVENYRPTSSILRSIGPRIGSYRTGVISE